MAAHDNLAVKNGLQLKYCDKFIETPFSRSPRSPDNPKAYKQLKKLLSEEHYDVILCNTPMGGIVTRLAAKKTRKQGTKVIYMAHIFTRALPGKPGWSSTPSRSIWRRSATC